jgi:hypothetical protein
MRGYNNFSEHLLVGDSIFLREQKLSRGRPWTVGHEMKHPKDFLAVKDVSHSDGLVFNAINKARVATRATLEEQNDNYAHIEKRLFAR